MQEPEATSEWHKDVKDEELQEVKTECEEMEPIQNAIQNEEQNDTHNEEQRAIQNEEQNDTQNEEQNATQNEEQRAQNEEQNDTQIEKQNDLREMLVPQVSTPFMSSYMEIQIGKIVSKFFGGGYRGKFRAREENNFKLASLNLEVPNF